MEVSIQHADGIVRVEIRNRESADETRAVAEATFAEIERSGARAALMRIRDSRPIFKVESYGLSGILERIAAYDGLRVAVVADDAELHAAHQYVEVLARQRGVPYRAFRTEEEALAWLTPAAR
ncbi:MAG TPA: hypothetical protein VEB41_17420 [Burkholderiales bacterium]|nr:hypothetical protein [Burkholderiales bacterium]